MKKVWGIVLATLMVAASLCGCAGSPVESASPTTGTSVEASTEAETPTPEPAATESADASESAEASESAGVPMEAEEDAESPSAKGDHMAIGDALKNGDYEAAAKAAADAGFEPLATELRTVADAASKCNVTKEPFSGNVMVYGDSNTVIDGTTNAIPFMNVTGAYVNLQLGFVDVFDDIDSFYGGYPTDVELTTGEEHWSWQAAYEDVVSDISSTQSTWVFETGIPDNQLSMLTSVGATESGKAQVRFTDPAVGKKDYSLTEAEIAAFGNLGAFVDALVPAISDYNTIADQQA